jgi:hypothetical protein
MYKCNNKHLENQVRKIQMIKIIIINLESKIKIIIIKMMITLRVRDFLYKIFKSKYKIR